MTNLMTNSADPDQLGSSEAYWSESTPFAKQYMTCSARERLRLSTMPYVLFYFKIGKPTYETVIYTDL